VCLSIEAVEYVETASGKAGSRRPVLDSLLTSIGFTAEECPF
jgi:hypothetical protein